jgi:rhodanese-related sulfurtransferase
MLHQEVANAIKCFSLFTLNFHEMHVHDLNPKKTLITLIGFTILLIIGFLTIHRPTLNYNLDMKQSLEMLNDSNDFFYPYQLISFLNKTNKDVVLIDLRNNFIYGQGHIPGAENISAFDLALKENIDRLENFKKQGMTVVFYGDDQLQANGSWMLFRQLGFDNIKILLGGYQYYIQHENDLVSSPNKRDYVKGDARYDYAKVAATPTTVNVKEQDGPKSLIINRKKKHTVSAGGC